MWSPKSNYVICVKLQTFYLFNGLRYVMTFAVALTLAPRLIRTIMTSVWRARAATCNAVSPLDVGVSKDDPPSSSRYVTAATWPVNAATCSGVSPDYTIKTAKVQSLYHQLTVAYSIHIRTVCLNCTRLNKWNILCFYFCTKKICNIKAKQKLLVLQGTVRT